MRKQEQEHAARQGSGGLSQQNSHFTLKKKMYEHKHAVIFRNRRSDRGKTSQVPLINCVKN